MKLPNKEFEGSPAAAEPRRMPGRAWERGERGSFEVERILQRKRDPRLAYSDAQGDHLETEGDALITLAQELDSIAAPLPTRYSGDPELVVAADGASQAAEVFRELRRQMLTIALQRRSRAALAIVSPQRGEGKSYVAANLAVSLAQPGGRTLLIDADLRTPRLHRLLRVDEGDGLSGLLAGHVHAPHIHEFSELPGFYFLPAGRLPQNPVELLQSPRFSLLLYKLLPEFDHIVLDTAADSWGADARIIAAKAGMALVVGRKNRSTIEGLDALLGALSGDIAGVVMNTH